MAPSEFDSARKRAQAALDDRRCNWDPHWRDVDEMFSTRKSRYLAQNKSRKYEKNREIIRNFAVICARRFQAGLMAGITSPARPWFRLTTKDPELVKSHAVRDWMHDVEDIIRTAIERSGLYRSINKIYGDIGFGTAAMLVDEHPERVVVGYSLPLGTYCLAANATGDVDTIYRTPTLNARQMLELFPRDAVTQSVRTAADHSDYSTTFDVVHAIEPNPDFDPRRADLQGKRWLSRWWQADGGKKFLKEGGYEEFPAMTPRWQTTGEDVYGTGPFMDAQADVRELQHHAKQKLRAIDLGITPPMGVPSSLRGQPVSLLPNGKTYVDNNQKVEPLINVNPTMVQIVGAEMEQVKSAIASATYSDLFLLFSESDRRQVTAEEIRAKQDEKMLQIGPAFSQLDEEFLRPLIDRVFYSLARRRMLPPAPEELRTAPLDIEYLNLMSQAQRLIQAGGEREFVGFIGSLIGVVGPGTPAAEDILDKVNVDNIIESHAQITSCPPDHLRTPEQVTQRRQAREQAMAQQQADAQAMAQAKAAKDMAGASLEDNNLLTAQLGGPVPGVEAQ